MIIQLPLTADPIQDFITQLGAIKYEFLVQWNDRGGIWTMDMSTASDNVSILTGMPLLLGCDLIDPYLINNGSMVVYDETGSGIDAGINDLGTRVNVYWYSADEVANVTAA